jgi:pyruvate formate lyase activating enzyme
MHSDFLLPVLKELGKRKIHRTIDTTGFASANTLKIISKQTDLFLYDLKLIDSDKHLKFTGQRNETILTNLRWLSHSGAKINIRIPLIKGVNANAECINKIAEFILGLSKKPKSINLLAYHDIAKMKYEKLGSIYSPGNISTPTDDEVEAFAGIFKNHGLQVDIGG